MYFESIVGPLGLLAQNFVPPTTEFVVGGFYNAGDGGGGTFIWVPGPNAASGFLDNGIIFNKTAGTAQTGYFQRIFSGPVNVRWFGAIYELGVRDDVTDYVHAARDSAAFANNGTLYFPVGDYPGAFEFTHKKGQRNEINIVGDGWGTVLRSNGKTAIQGLLPEGYPILTLGITDYTHWRWRKVSNLRLDGMAILPGKGGNLPDTQHLTSTRTNHVTPLPACRIRHI